MQVAVDERLKVFVSAHFSEKDHQADTSASRHPSSVIAKAMTETWHVNCFFLSFKLNLRLVFSLLRPIAEYSATLSD